MRMVAAGEPSQVRDSDTAPLGARGEKKAAANTEQETGLPSRRLARACQQCILCIFM
jgi:hypothetical protein